MYGERKISMKVCNEQTKESAIGKVQENYENVKCLQRATRHIQINHPQSHPHLLDEVRWQKFVYKTSCKVFMHNCSGSTVLKIILKRSGTLTSTTLCLSQRIARWQGRIRSCSRSRRDCTPS